MVQLVHQVVSMVQADAPGGFHGAAGASGGFHGAGWYTRWFP